MGQERKSRIAFVVAAVAAVVGCAHPGPAQGGSAARSSSLGRRLDNLRRAATLPWTDDGRCAVRASEGDWSGLVEACFDALDRSRIRFVDQQGVCPVAQAGVLNADAAMRLVGICLLVQPELALGAVIVVGVVVVAAAIAAEIEAADRAKKRRKWCDCYCGKNPVPVLTNTLDFECRSECVLLGYGPTDYVCR